SPDRGIGLKGEPQELPPQRFRGTPDGKVKKVAFQAGVFFLGNPHMRVPSPVTHGVAPDLYWHPPSVADRPCLLREEGVAAVRRKDDEEAAEPEVLDVRLLRPLPPGTGPPRDRDPVAVDELLVDGLWRLLLRDPARNVEEVAVSDVGDCELLDKTREGGGFVAVHEPVI